MEIRRYNSPAEFLARASEWLMQAEVENNVILSICARMRDSGLASPESYFATVEDGGEVVACAVRQPPKKAVLSRGRREAMACLVADMFQAFRDLPVVLGPEPDVVGFADLWTSKTGGSHHFGMRQRVFELRRASPLIQRPSGTMRPATERDSQHLVEWISAFVGEVGLEPRAANAGPGKSVYYPAEELVRSGLAHRTLFVWDDDGAAVSLASAPARTPNGVRISMVFTPVRFRGRGYATACVSALSQQLLSTGCSYCCIVTDLANPTSNSIYQKIGYRPVCDISDVILGLSQGLRDKLV
jgi:uncharacterized protein